MIARDGACRMRESKMDFSKEFLEDKAYRPGLEAYKRG